MEPVPDFLHPVHVIRVIGIHHVRHRDGDHFPTHVFDQQGITTGLLAQTHQLLLQRRILTVKTGTLSGKLRFILLGQIALQLQRTLTHPQTL